MVRDAPAEVCQQCGEAYFDSKVTSRLYEQVMQTMDSAAEVEIIHLNAA